MNVRSKYFCFTLNNFGCDDVLRLRALGRRLGRVTYLVFGREGRSPGHTPHLQGYIEFQSRVRGTQAKACVSTRAHIESRRGTSEEASAYCKKEADYEEFGCISITREGQGRRSDLLAIQEKLSNGVSEVEIASQHFSQWVYHRKSFAAYRSLIQEPRTEPSLVYVFYGEPGTGKTREVVATESDLWIAPDNQLNWFDGYVGQEAVLFDDFVGCKNKKFGFLLQLLDRYPLQVPVKGGFVNWIPKRIYMTSNLAPTEWFIGVSPSQMNALYRRFEEIREFTLE